MKLHLAGVLTHTSIFEEYLKNESYINEQGVCSLIDVPILESFYYINKTAMRRFTALRHFLLDSGAFTFFGSNANVDWNEYLEKYIRFINDYNVEHFFELDIDSLVGYENVLRFRKRIEAETHKQPIPVWHKSRGKNDFLKMCSEYPYVAIGGIVSKEISSSEYDAFHWFIDKAHKSGAKIHGLGFTSPNGIAKYKFDSVDSTSWVSGSRFGTIYKFDGKTMIRYRKEGCRLSEPNAAAVHNLAEWVKFSKYCERHM